MDKKTKIAAAVIAAVVIVAAAVIFAAKGMQKKNTAPETTAAPVQAVTETSESEKKYTPTFMYFISKSDAGFDATNGMIEDLKKEYDGRVKFDIINVDDTPEAKENFPVDQQTPALIMLNTSNNISAIEFKCSDKQVLRQYIEAALK